MQPNISLDQYLTDLKEKKHRFENVFQSVEKMILSEGIEKINVLGKTVYDFNFFRKEKKHLVGWYEEINSFVTFISDAAEGGSSKEMAYVLVGEPGNGKTFFVDFLCDKYREFLSIPENRKFSFKFVGLDKLTEGDKSKYGPIKSIESQTFEDPVILAMNLFGDRVKNINFLEQKGFTNEQIETFFDEHRPLGACSDYILNEIRDFSDGDIEKMLEFIEIFPVKLSATQGTVTGKYSAKDKITSSGVDLVGEESMQRLMYLTDSDNPYKFDIRRGALGRVGGGGIHFPDELFRNKKDLIQIYLGVIQNRVIEIDGYKWPIDALIVGTSNNDVFSKFQSDAEEAPIIDRCRISFVGHNTNYKEQSILTRYSLGDEKNKRTLTDDKLHVDPNLIYAVNVSVVLTRLPETNKLTSIEMLKLAAGEVAGEKSIKTLIEIIDELNRDPDVTKRFGQRGIGQRNLGRSIQKQLEMSETNEGKCMYAEDYFIAIEKIVLDYVVDTELRKKYLDDIGTAKSLYRERIQTEMFNAYMDKPDAIISDVKGYVNMIIAIADHKLGPDKIWRYRDPQTGEQKTLRIDEHFIDNVEDRLGLKTDEQKKTYRNRMRQLYAQKIQTEVDYNFMDNLDLVKAVTDVRLNSDVGTASSLVGALANRAEKGNQAIHNRLLITMKDKLGYCDTCAHKTIEYFCTPIDEN